MVTSFEQFNLHPALLKGLAALGFTTPTPVQQHAIPLVLDGKDAIVQAKTGSGKTLAFALPVLSMLVPRSRPQALVVLPTRELAIQVCEAIATVSNQSPLRTLAIYGGVGLGPQESALGRGVDIIVGTPGRLKDLIQRKSLDLSQVRVLILDEADEMLDMGFRKDIEFLMNRMPAREQTLILSATMPAAMEAIARGHMHNPVVVKLAPEESTPSEISHYFIRLQLDQRVDGLIALLEDQQPERAIIFTRMKHETKRIAEKLERLAGLKAGYLNGNMSQNARNRMLDGFRNGEFRYLVATDVAARGLDIEGLSLVIHFAVPTVVETYIHRSGRTGRAGNIGKTIIMVTPDAEVDFKAICKKIACEEIRGITENLPAVTTAAAKADRQLDGPRAPQPGRRQGQGRGGDRASGNGRTPQGMPRSAEPASRPAPGFDAGRPSPGFDAGRGRTPNRVAQPAKAPDAGTFRERPAPARAHTAAPRASERWRKVRLPLATGHNQTEQSLQRWLLNRTTVAVRSVALFADHAIVEVEQANVEPFLKGLKSASRH